MVNVGWSELMRRDQLEEETRCSQQISLVQGTDWRNDATAEPSLVGGAQRQVAQLALRPFQLCLEQLDLGPESRSFQLAPLV